MKNKVICTLGAIVLIVMLFQAVVIHHLMIDYRYYKLLSSEPCVEDIISSIGKPEFKIKDGEKILGMGWSPPKLRPGKEVWVYTNMTGTRFYVFIDVETKQFDYFTSSPSS